MLLFFFYCYGDHRALNVLTHTFPTPRSSDLEPMHGLASLHLLNIETHETEFITSARQPFPGDLEGGGTHVAWIENACQVNEAQTETLEIGRANVRTPVTNPNLVCRLLLEKKQQ